jgi:hypothetical protein
MGCKIELSNILLDPCLLLSRTFSLQVAWASKSCIRDRGNTPLHANEACGPRAWLAVVFSLLRMSDKGHMHSEGNRGAVASALAASTRLLGGEVAGDNEGYFSLVFR